MGNTTSSSETTSSVCANCGKEGTDVTNTCDKCKSSVMYCNATCRKRHRRKHKKDCEEHVKRAAEKDEKLFKQPPPNDDCPICMIRLPTLESGRRYYTCCGKTICSGCICAPVYDDEGNEVDDEKCAFCRAPAPESDEEIVERTKKRMEMNDSIAIYNQGCDYFSSRALWKLGGWFNFGKHGYPDYTKAFKLWHQAGELGCATSYYNIGNAYFNGRGVGRDVKKAIHYFELAAMSGDVDARQVLGCIEYGVGNTNRARKHWMIAVRSGCNESLTIIQKLYSCGYVTREDCIKALQSYQTYLDEIKSYQRNKAAEADDEYKYYEEL